MEGKIGEKSENGRKENRRESENGRGRENRRKMKMEGEKAKMEEDENLGRKYNCKRDTMEAEER